MAERRKYIRIATVLPVECRLTGTGGETSSPWFQGFTNDIGKGGICLVINDLWKGFAQRFRPGARIDLIIHLSMTTKKICLCGKVAWFERERFSEYEQCRCGVEFIEASPQDMRALCNYARAKKYLPLVNAFVIAFLVFLAFSFWFSQRTLITENKKLVDDYTRILKEIAFLKEMAKGEDTLSAPYRAQQLVLEEEEAVLTEKVIGNMYDWIAQRRNVRTGLILSYEGDEYLDRIAFTYDQALSVIVFLLFDDVPKAKKILDFYYRELERTPSVYNAYYTGGKVAEYITHCGPNAWLGLASLHYTEKTNDERYLFIARRIASFLLEMMDDEGGIRGGPELTWYSTEHNLDCYAFFTMLYEATNDASYQEAAEKIKHWLATYAYTTESIPINRGKGDATIATDTYAWSITALGVAALLELDMDPERIIEFAITNCEVETVFAKGEYLLKVRGFDFVRSRNRARGGIISCEWTAQMVLAFEILADYYRQKDKALSDRYRDEAVFYFDELKKMVISSPSPMGKGRAALPYASSPNSDTGHGWRTPRGDQTGSLASSAYFLIVYKGYNPLRGEYVGISLEEDGK